MTNWSAEQLRAIQETGHCLLLSAAAGSGKTETLSERCAHLTCVADFCDVNELLVVTFTEEAAAEMKGRIEQAILQKLKDNPANAKRIRRQVALLPGAQVSTIHAFCARLLKRHFQAIRLDPAFRVLDEQEAALLQREVAADLFEESFAARDPNFTRLVDLYADGRDLRIEDEVIATHDVLRSQLDAGAWRAQAIARLRDVEAHQDFFTSEIGREFQQLAITRIERVIGHATSVSKTIGELSDCGDIRDVVQKLAAGAKALLTLVTAGQWAEAQAMLGPEFLPKLKGRPASPERDLAKALRESVVAPFRSGGDVQICFARDPATLRHEIISTIAPAECFLNLVGQFSERYAAAKRETNALDFSDLEHLALQVLSDDAIRRDCQSRFKNIMVDEFQDVNGVQWELLSRLATPGPDGKPANLFCVGDVKQSIYRFRLADPSIFLHEQSRTFAGHVIDMRHNFRSRKPLLDAINTVFRGLMHKEAAEIEYDASQELDGKRVFPPPADGSFAGSPIELHLLPDKKDLAAAGEEGSDKESEEDLSRIEREAAYVAAQVGQLMSEGRQVGSRDGSYRPFQYGDIAILLRSAKFTILEYSRALADAGIPAFSESRTGFFQAIEITDMLAILQLLDNQQQDIPMAAHLRSPVAALANAEDALATVRVAYPQMPFHAAVVCYAREQHDALGQSLRQVIERLDRWRQRALMVSVADLLWEIFSETGYPAFCAGLKGGPQRVANLMYLHRCARRFSHFQRQGLFRFMQYLKQLEEKSDLGQPSAGEPGNAVRVMTIHAAKGLEFPVVIISGINARWNMRDLSGAILNDRDRYLAISVADEANNIRYPSAASWIVKEQIRRATMAEELRVLYVAMTRAQEHLVLVGTCAESARDRALMMPPPGLDPYAFTSAGSMLQWLLPLVKTSGRQIRLVYADDTSDGQTAPETPAPTETVLPEAPEGFWDQPYAFADLTYKAATTSVTGLSKGNEVPAVTPDVTDDSVSASADAELAKARGIAVHLFMEHLDFAPTAAPLPQQLAELVNRGLLTAQQAALVSVDDVTWLLNHSPVASLLRDQAGSIHREIPLLDSVAADGNVATLTGLDRVLLRGRIDVVVPTNDGIIVVDYKTDRTYPEKGSEREQAYRTQVNLYRQTIERSGLGKVAAVYLVFLSCREVLAC